MKKMFQFSHFKTRCQNDDQSTMSKKGYVVKRLKVWVQCGGTTRKNRTMINLKCIYWHCDLRHFCATNSAQDISAQVKLGASQTRLKSNSAQVRIGSEKK